MSTNPTSTPLASRVQSTASTHFQSFRCLPRTKSHLKPSKPYAQVSKASPSRTISLQKMHEPNYPARQICPHRSESFNATSLMLFAHHLKHQRKRGTPWKSSTEYAGTLQVTRQHHHLQTLLPTSKHVSHRHDGLQCMKAPQTRSSKFQELLQQIFASYASGKVLKTPPTSKTLPRHTL